MNLVVVSPDHKKKDPFNKENYWPISVLPALSKVFRKAIDLQPSSFLNRNFSNFLGTYRNSFSPQHALIRVIEEWKTSLEAKKHTAPVQMDPSKASGNLSTNLITAKFAA